MALMQCGQQGAPEEAPVAKDAFFRLDYLAYLMIFASLPSSIVFTMSAGY